MCKITLRHTFTFVCPDLYRRNKSTATLTIDDTNCFNERVANKFRNKKVKKKNTLVYIYNVCRLCLPKMGFRYENVIHYLVMFIHVMSVKFYFIKKVTYTEWLFWNINGDSKTYKMVFGKVSCAATFMNTI